MKKPAALRNKTIIVGCGRLGALIATKCAKEGKNLLVVDENQSALDRLNDDFSGYPVLGECTDLDVLESAYIKSCKEIIIVTGEDHTNILVAYIAKKIYGVPNIYIRLSDPDNEILLKGLGVRIIFPLELSYDKFNLMRGGNR